MFLDLESVISRIIRLSRMIRYSDFNVHANAVTQVRKALRLSKFRKHPLLRVLSWCSADVIFFLSHKNSMRRINILAVAWECYSRQNPQAHDVVLVSQVVAFQ